MDALLAHPLEGSPPCQDPNSGGYRGVAMVSTETPF